ncbi:jg23429, partial [Pararge aegeria aegeria]
GYCKLEPSESVEYRCRITDYPNSDGTRDCLASEPEGTVIQPRCRQPHYFSVTELPNMNCENGKWNYIPRCERECGRLPAGGVPLIVGGRELENGYVPWAAGVYYADGGQMKQVGSAIVISRHIALTVIKVGNDPGFIAPQCLTHGHLIKATSSCLWKVDSGDSFDSTMKVWCLLLAAAHVLRLDMEWQYLAIAAGKRHRQWQHPLDEGREQNSMSAEEFCALSPTTFIRSTKSLGEIKHIL